jgi:hypothetical protein
MGLLRKFAVVASSAVAVAAMGVVYAGTASASPTAQALCVNANGVVGQELICAQAVPGGNPSVQAYFGPGTKWYYPDPGLRTIASNNGDGCMQVVTGTTAYNIQLHSCDSHPAQEFTAIQCQNGGIDGGGTCEFYSSIGSAECLAYDMDTAGFHLWTCNGAWYEQFLK